MMQSPTFGSALADRFSQYVQFRRLGGVDSHSQTQLLGYFGILAGARSAASSSKTSSGGKAAFAFWVSKAERKLSSL